MIDYCLKNTDEAEFNQLMLDTGLCVEVTEGEGEEAVTTIIPADYTILIDRIGPITIGETTYPEYRQGSLWKWCQRWRIAFRTA